MKKTLLVPIFVVMPSVAFAGEPRALPVPQRDVTWSMTSQEVVNTGVHRAKKVSYNKTTGKIRLK